MGFILFLSSLPAEQPSEDAYLSAAFLMQDTFLPSYHACSECHGRDPDGIASVTAQGEDVNVVHDWQVSMKAFAAKDPLWRSQMEYELLYHDSSDLEGCLRCHAPAAYHKALLHENSFTLADLEGSTLAKEGVQCASCHQMANFDAVNGMHTYTEDGTIKGPYPQPFSGPMQDLFGWPVEYDPVMRSSEACKSCHSVFHESSSGQILAEQATYFEWARSAYQKQQKECQFCHMPYVFDSIKLATEYPFLEGRIPFARHQFLGANHWILTAMRDQFDQSAQNIPDSIWENRLRVHKDFLKTGATLRIMNSELIPDDHLLTNIEIANLSGHKFPTGYPSRKALVEFLVIDLVSRDTIFHSGEPHEFFQSESQNPHFDMIQADDQVQVYEFLALDATHNTNYSLLSADTIQKDNRIPPIGFTAVQNDTFGVKGFALEDPDYSNGLGKDRLQYLVPVDRESRFGIQAHLYYMQIQHSWLQTLTQTDFQTAIELESYSRKNPPITLISSDTSYVDLTSATRPTSEKEMIIYPNPVRAGQTIHILSHSTIQHVEIVNSEGWSHTIRVNGNRFRLPEELTTGIYFFVFENGVVRKIIVQ